jgi:hypothetical protein
MEAVLNVADTPVMRALIATLDTSPALPGAI